MFNQPLISEASTRVYEIVGLKLKSDAYEAVSQFLGGKVALPVHYVP
jgi:hypothetical protein